MIYVGLMFAFLLICVQSWIMSRMHREQRKQTEWLVHLDQRVQDLEWECQDVKP